MEFSHFREVDEEVDLEPYRPPVDWRVSQWLWDSSVLLQIAFAIHLGVLVLAAFVMSGDVPVGAAPFQRGSAFAIALFVATVVGLVLLMLGLFLKGSFWPWHHKFWIVLVDAIFVGIVLGLSGGFVAF
ncbi:MAG: hypothetical protein AAF664_09235 [Planctomycetota bacterium]